MTDTRTCCVCGRDRPAKDCKIARITAAEEKALVTLGLKPDSEYAYCHGCWRTLQDASTGPSLMRGALERWLLRMGWPTKRAKVMADRYQTRLVELQRRARHSTHS